MELAVLRIARIAGERRPDLAGHAVVSCDRDDVGIANVVRTQEIDIARRRRRGRDLDALFMRCPSSKLALTATPGDIAGRARMSRQKRGVREEMGDAVRGERFLQARRVRAL